jgi:diguanylate cyclase (GGDEF)-like protein
MISHRIFCMPRWRLATILAVIFFALSAVMVSYVNSAYQRASADYTKLVSDIVIAQQAAPQLQAALKGGSQQLAAQHIEYISYFISLSQQHLDSIQASINSHRFLTPGVEYPNTIFNELNDRFLRLDQLARAAQERLELIDQLQRSAIEAGGIQTNLYTQLLDEVHHASQQQRLGMQRFSVAIGTLLVLVLSAAITLCIAVLHLHRQRNLMRTLMLTDELTGLYNRRHLVNVSFAALTQAQRDKKPLSLLLLDIDHFKHINDSYGHPIGDEALRQISERLRQLSRPSDTLARIGGEEFCLLMPNTDTYDALQVADRLRREVESMTFNGLGLHSNPTISIGATTGYGRHNFEQLYSLADKALYQAKTFGRNRVESLLPTVAPSPDYIDKAYFHGIMSQTSDT